MEARITACTHVFVHAQAARKFRVWNIQKTEQNMEDAGVEPGSVALALWSVPKRALSGHRRLAIEAARLCELTREALCMCVYVSAIYLDLK